jgi:type IV pilus assembly protein PilB
MRILDSATATRGLEMLGYEPEQLELLREAIARPYGMVLVTGPTGSGKTVSLIRLSEHPESARHEYLDGRGPGGNPIARRQSGQRQRQGGTRLSPRRLRAFLRQDPDIVMVGEIRDLETGDIAIKAAQTGHMVLSTLHTNDAPSTLTRMLNMGIPSYNVVASVLLITAQRLGRAVLELQAAHRHPASGPA